MCMAAAGNGSANGTEVGVWKCLAGTGSQRWTGAGSGNALTDPGNSTKNGTQPEMGVNRGDLSPPWHVSFRHYPTL